MYLIKTLLLKAIVFSGTILLLLHILTPDIFMSGIVSPHQYKVFYSTLFIVLVTATICSLFRPPVFRFCRTDCCLLLSILYIVLNFWLSGSEATTKLQLLILLAVSYFVFRLLLSSKGGRLTVTAALLTTGLIEAVWGLKQLYGFSESYHSYYKFTGSFFNPGPYSGFLGVILPFALYYTLRLYPVKGQLWKLDGNRLQRAGYGLFFILSASCFLSICLLLPAGMSRSAWLASATGCVLIVFLHNRFKSFREKWDKRIKKNLPLYSGVTFIIIMCSAIGVYSLKKDSADGRLLMWKVTAQIIKEHPWTGVGTAKFAGAYGMAQAGYFAQAERPEQEKSVAGSPEYGFNEYLQITAEYGVVGLLLFLCLISAALGAAIRYKNAVSTAGLAAFLIFAFFSYPFSVLPLCSLFVLLLALCASPPYPQGKIIPPAYIRSFLILLAMISGTGAFLLHRKQEGWSNWKNEKCYFDMNIFEGTADNYSKLYPQLREYGPFLFEYGQCLSKTGQYEESNRILYMGAQLNADPMFYNIIGKNYQAMKQFEQAERAFLHASNMVPHRLYPLYLLANLYFESGETEKAIATATTVINKKPKIASPATRNMQQVLRQKLKEKNISI